LRDRDDQCRQQMIKNSPGARLEIQTSDLQIIARSKASPSAQQMSLPYGSPRQKFTNLLLAKALIGSTGRI